MESSEEAVEMDAKTRIMSIYLMDMLQKNPCYMETLGIEAVMERTSPKAEKSYIRPVGGLTETGKPFYAGER